jgi:hypothetical protein
LLLAVELTEVMNAIAIVGRLQLLRRDAHHHELGRLRQQVLGLGYAWARGYQAVEEHSTHWCGCFAETDDEKKEQFSPWPVFIHEEILTERARLRMAMKADMNKYKDFVDTHMKGFQAWWSRLGESAKVRCVVHPTGDVSLATLTDSVLVVERLLQLPDEEVLSYFRVHTKVKGSYEIVRTAEQSAASCWVC